MVRDIFSRRPMINLKDCFGYWNPAYFSGQEVNWVQAGSSGVKTLSNSECLYSLFSAVETFLYLKFFLNYFCLAYHLSKFKSFPELCFHRSRIVATEFAKLRTHKHTHAHTHTHTHTHKLQSSRKTPKGTIEDNLKIEDDLKKENNLINENDLKNEDDLKMRMTSKMKTT